MKTLLSDRIKRLRVENGLSQKQFAEALGKGFSQATVSKYEVGDMEPPLDRLVRIADFGQVSVDWLLGRSEDRNRDASIIDQIGLDDETVSILKRMAEEARTNFCNARLYPENHPDTKADPKLWKETEWLNRILRSPHLRPLLYAIDDLYQAAKEYSAFLNSPHIKNVPELEDMLSALAAKMGLYTPVIADLNTVVQVKTSAAVDAARKIIEDVADIEYWTKENPDRYKKEAAEAEKRLAEHDNDVTSYVIPERMKEGTDNGNDRTSEK